MKKNSNKKSTASKVLKAGVAFGAVAGAAYLLFGPDGKKHQKKLGEWVKTIKKEVEKDVIVAKKTISKEIKKIKKS